MEKWNRAIRELNIRVYQYSRYNFNTFQVELVVIEPIRRES